MAGQPLLSHPRYRQGFWEPVCPSAIPLGSFPPTHPCQYSVSQGQEPDVIIKEREAMISHLSRGLRGRFQGNDNVGHCDSPEGTHVIFPAPS